MMKTLIQKIKKGKIAAMRVLYNSNKSKVWFLCQKVLFDQKEADNATVFVLKKAWEEIIPSRISTVEEFSIFVIQRAVTYCKNYHTSFLHFTISRHWFEESFSLLT